MNIGFEFEFLSDLSRAELRNEFAMQVGFVPKGLNFEKQSSGKDWILTEDPSVKDLKNKKAMGHELITPVFNLDDAIENLIECFDFIKEVGYTNKSCGLHVNIDLGPDTKDIDIVHLLSYINEDEILTRYGRTRNKFCRRVKPKIKSILRNLRKVYPLQHLKDRIYHQFEECNYDSVNLYNLDTKGYVEFRMIGGKDYHLRPDEVTSDIFHFVDSMIAAKYSSGNRKLIKEYNDMMVAGGVAV